jgi:isocitrate dehydrogenase (NAD+)
MTPTAHISLLFVLEAFHFRFSGFLTHVLQLCWGLRTKAGRVVEGLNPHSFFQEEKPLANLELNDQGQVIHVPQDLEITLIEGEGIGPEIMPHVIAVAEKAFNLETGGSLSFDRQEVGATALSNCGTPYPQSAIDSLTRCKAAIKGPIETPLGGGFTSVTVWLRQTLDLYANVRPCKYMSGVRTRLLDPEGVNLVILRENTEDLYAGVEAAAGSEAAQAIITTAGEYLPKAKTLRLDETAIGLKPISISKTRRVAEFAAALAKTRRNHVTIVVKSNIMKFTDGLFASVSEQVMKAHNVDYRIVLVDAFNMKLFQCPEQFDVVLTLNLYGDVESDGAAALIGGIGMAPSANVGKGGAFFEGVHGSAPDIAGQGKANPSALMLATAMMFDWMGLNGGGQRIRYAVQTTLERGIATIDVAPTGVTSVSTSDFGQAVLDRI